MTPDNGANGQRTQAETRRIRIAKFRLYSLLCVLAEDQWTAHEHAIMSTLENDPEVAKAIRKTYTRQRVSRQRGGGS